MALLRLVAYLLLAVILIIRPHMVFAHVGQPIAPHDFWAAWNGEFALLLTLEVTGFVYLLGIVRLWRRAGLGRGVSIRRCAAFLGGLLALVIALVSPLDALGGALFSAHMIQHLLLSLVAAPLLVLSEFPLVMMWALPRPWAQLLARRWNQAHDLQRVSKFLNHHLIVWMLFGVTLWVWHASALYQAALEDEAIHAIEHLSFLLSAILFWRGVLDSSRPESVRYGVAALCLFTSALHGGVLGALLTFSSELWYPIYAASTFAWGLSPLQDQQLAGLVMWIPVGTIFTLLALFYFKAWISVLEQRRPPVQPYYPLS